MKKLFVIVFFFSLHGHTQLMSIWVYDTLANGQLYNWYTDTLLPKSASSFYFMKAAVKKVASDGSVTYKNYYKPNDIITPKAKRRIFEGGRSTN